MIQAGYNVVILDNLHNSSTEAVRRIEGIVDKSVPFEKVDLTDFDAVKGVFAKYSVASVIHFAGLKVPLKYLSINHRLLERAEKSHWSIIVSMLEGVSI